MIFVPYKGAAPAITDLLGGQIQVGAAAKSVLLPLIRAGKLRPLAVTSMTRWPELPEIPTMRESGFAGYPSEIWFGLLAPAATPRRLSPGSTPRSTNACSLPICAIASRNWGWR